MKAKSCRSGYYWCFTDKKCKKIPVGYHIGARGYLYPDKDDDGNSDGNGNGKNGNGNGSNHSGNSGSNGGSGGGGGTVFANIRPADSHGYNGGSQTQDDNTVPAGWTTNGSDGSKGQRGSGFSDGNPNPGSGGSAGSGTIAALGYDLGQGQAGNTANRGHGASQGSNNSGGSGQIYILHDSALTYSNPGGGVTSNTGTYSGSSFVQITGGSGNISFS